MSEPYVAMWRRRFAEKRIDGRKDQARPGRPQLYGPEDRLRLVATVTSGPPDPASHWSHSQLAETLSGIGISASQIGRILADLDLKPHRVKYWIARRDDPHFWERAADVCGLYLHAPDHALVLSGDETSQTPVRSRTQPTTPLAPGRPERQENEYVRHGLAHQVAAMDMHHGGIFHAEGVEANSRGRGQGPRRSGDPPGDGQRLQATSPTRPGTGWLPTTGSTPTSRRRMPPGSTRWSCSSPSLAAG